MIKNFTLILLSFTFYLNSYSQTLKARVIDENNQPAIGANVYFDGTTIGVITDLDGYFTIDVPAELENAYLVISFLGYETIYIRDINSIESSYQLKLKPNTLETVNVYTQYLFSRQQLEDAFKTHFLGSDEAAEQCDILNIDDLAIYYVEEDMALYAQSYNPLIVDNKFLGYRVEFELTGFKVKFNKKKSIDDRHMKTASYVGYRFFKETDSTMVKNRKLSYEGTFKHFLKALIDDKIKKEDFKIVFRYVQAKPKNLFDMEKIEGGNTRVTLNRKFTGYLDYRFEPVEFKVVQNNMKSYVTFTEPSIRVDEHGNNLDINNIVLRGHFANYSKVGRLLPADYKYNTAKE